MPRFLELNQKVLEIFLVLANPRGFLCCLAIGIQIWGACLKRRDSLLLQLEFVALDKPLTLEMQHIHNLPRLCEAEKEQGV